MPYFYGPYGEHYAQQRILFGGSTVTGILPNTWSELQALPGEAVIALEYSLPLTDDGCTLLFRRVRHAYNQATSIVEIKDKKNTA